MKKGWQTRKVSEIAEHSLGKMLDKAKNKGEPRPYLRNLNVRWFGFDLSDILEMRFLPEEAAKYTAVKGDVLICEGGYPGRAAIWDRDEPIYFQKALHRVRFHEPRRSKWFLYYLLSKDLDGTLKNHFNGSGIQHFTGESLAEFEIPLPPLPEQERIVALLDEAFAGIAIAKANAERNRENARAVFESHLQSSFTQRDEGWERRSLADLCIVDWGNTDLTKSSYVRGGRYLAVSAAGCDGRIGHKEHVRHTPVLSAIGAQCGRMFLPDEDFTAIKNTITLTPLAGKCTGKFLYRLLTHVELPKRGAAQPFIAKGDVTAFQVVVPTSLRTQQEIEESLSQLEAETLRLARAYELKLGALEDLKRSLLREAFRGKLHSGP